MESQRRVSRVRSVARDRQGRAQGDCHGHGRRELRHSGSVRADDAGRDQRGRTRHADRQRARWAENQRGRCRWPIRGPTRHAAAGDGQRTQHRGRSIRTDRARHHRQHELEVPRRRDGYCPDRESIQPTGERFGDGGRHDHRQRDEPADDRDRQRIESGLSVEQRARHQQHVHGHASRSRRQPRPRAGTDQRHVPSAGRPAHQRAASRDHVRRAEARFSSARCERSGKRRRRRGVAAGTGRPRARCRRDRHLPSRSSGDPPSALRRSHAGRRMDDGGRRRCCGPVFKGPRRAAERPPGERQPVAGPERFAVGGRQREGSQRDYGPRRERGPGADRQTPPSGSRVHWNVERGGSNHRRSQVSGTRWARGGHEWRLPAALRISR